MNVIFIASFLSRKFLLVWYGNGAKRAIVFAPPNDFWIVSLCQTVVPREYTGSA